MRETTDLRTQVSLATPHEIATTRLLRASTTCWA